MLEAELAATTKRQHGQTPTEAPEPSPNKAPLKKTKMAMNASPIKPLNLDLKGSAAAALAQQVAPSSVRGSANEVDNTLALLGDLDVDETYVAPGSDGDEVVPEFGDTLVIPDEGVDDSQLSTVLTKASTPINYIYDVILSSAWILPNGS